jgi:hypothetical protein
MGYCPVCGSKSAEGSLPCSWVKNSNRVQTLQTPSSADGLLPCLWVTALFVSKKFKPASPLPCQRTFFCTNTHTIVTDVQNHVAFNTSTYHLDVQRLKPLSLVSTCCLATFIPRLSILSRLSRRLSFAAYTHTFLSHKVRRVHVAAVPAEPRLIAVL